MSRTTVDVFRDEEVSKWNSPSFEHISASSLRADSFFKAIELAKDLERELAEATQKSAPPEEGKPTDTEIFDWAANNPEKAFNEICSWWSTCGVGGREDSFNFRGVIRSLMLREKGASI